jgi:hypothetical protein
MTTSSDDEKHEALIEKCGMAGYGAYWVVVEKIAAQIRPECVSTSLTLSWRNWARHLRVDDVRTAKYLIKNIAEVGLILLEIREISPTSTLPGGQSGARHRSISHRSESELATIGVPNILKYGDEYTKRVGIKSRQTPDKLPTVSGSPALPALPAVPEEQDLKPIAPTPEKGNGSGSKPTAWVNLISWNRDKGCFEGITPEIVEKWEKAYPAVDLNSQLNRADEWLKANPTKQKKNYYRFVINWLARAQERGGR